MSIVQRLKDKVDEINHSLVPLPARDEGGTAVKKIAVAK